VLKDETMQSVAQSLLRNLRRRRDEYMGWMAGVSDDDSLEDMGNILGGIRLDYSEIFNGNGRPPNADHEAQVEVEPNTEQ
jgi:hypothetical protein